MPGGIAGLPGRTGGSFDPVGVAPGALVSTATGPGPARGAVASRPDDGPSRRTTTAIAAADAVTRPAAVAPRRRAGPATARFRSWTTAIGRGAGRGDSAAARLGRVPATRRSGRDLRRGRRASASATALCRTMRHRIALAGWLVVLRMTRPPRQLACYARALYAHGATFARLPPPGRHTPAEAGGTPALHFGHRQPLP